MNKKLNGDRILNNADARNQIIMESVIGREEEILKNHSYALWLGKDEYWHTYVYDAERKSKRRPVKKKSYEKMLYFIDENNRALNKKRITSESIQVQQVGCMTRKNMTLETLYKEWIKYKFIISSSTSYPYRISVDWNKYYVGTSIVKVPLEQLDSITLNMFVHSLVKKYNLTKKRYYNLAIILKQGLDFAVEKKYIKKNPYNNVKIDSRLFAKEKKKADETQVYLIDEEPQIINAIMNDYKGGKADSAALAIVIAFKTGLRLGELVALKFADIKNGNIYVERMEVRDYEIDVDGAFHYCGTSIVEHAKTDSSVRKVYLPIFVRNLLKEIEVVNRKENNQDENYIFCRNGKRVHSLAVERIIYRYCERMSISKKSMHKIRKTYISTLIDGNININKVRQLVGHEDERTTYKNYCYNRYSEEQTDIMLEDVLA